VWNGLGGKIQTPRQGIPLSFGERDPRPRAKKATTVPDSQFHSMLLLVRLIDLYSLVVLAAVILSWLGMDRRNPLAAIVYGFTEPVLAPIRQVLPPVGGLDFSPMVLLVVLQFLKGLLF
jgi:YggT family protein